MPKAPKKESHAVSPSPDDVNARSFTPPIPKTKDIYVQSFHTRSSTGVFLGFHREHDDYVTGYRVELDGAETIIPATDLLFITSLTKGENPKPGGRVRVCWQDRIRPLELRLSKTMERGPNGLVKATGADGSVFFLPFSRAIPVKV